MSSSTLMTLRLNNSDPEAHSILQLQRTLIVLIFLLPVTVKVVVDCPAEVDCGMHTCSLDYHICEGRHLL